MSPLNAKDAVFYYPHAAGSSVSTDLHQVYALAEPWARTAAVDTVTATARRRFHLAPLLHRRYERVPGNLEHPLLRSNNTFDESCIVGIRAATWIDAQDAVAEIMATPLDTERNTWTIVVVHGFDDGPDGTNVLLLVRLSHALTDGFGLASTARTLLFDLDLPVPQLTPIDTGSARMAAIRGLARMPVDLVRLGRGFVTVLRARARLRVRYPPSPTFERTRFNRPLGPERVARVLVFDDPSDPDTAIARAIAAIGEAMRRYLRDRGETVDELGAVVTLVLPRGVAWTASNRFVTGSVPLFCAIDDLDARAAAIRSEVTAARTRSFDPDTLSSFQLTDRVPPVILAALVARGARTPSAPADVPGHTVISTSSRPQRPSGGLGSVTFNSGFAMVTDAVPLTHGVTRAGRRITISVLTSPEVIDDIASYTAHLVDAAPFTLVE